MSHFNVLHLIIIGVSLSKANLITEPGCLPQNFSWVDRGAVSSVKDQYAKHFVCNAGYAFAAVGALEATMKIWYRQPLTNLSAQEIIDCTFGKGNYGCKAGFASYAFDHVIRAEGINSEKDYPYQGWTQICSPKRGVYAGIVGYKRVPFGNEDVLQSAIYCFGPATVWLDSFTHYWEYYTGGVLRDPSCSSAYGNHEVLVVGWGEQNHVPYWLIKNSWGTDWGEGGYIKLYRGINNCGIANYAHVPVPY